MNYIGLEMMTFGRFGLSKKKGKMMTFVAGHMLRKIQKIGKVDVEFKQLANKHMMILMEITNE